MNANPFAPTTAPTNESETAMTTNPFAQTAAQTAQAPAANPFAQQAAPQAQPAAQGTVFQSVAQAGGNPFGSAPAGGDPFASAPAAPELEGISQNDALLQTVVAWRVVKLDEGVMSSFKDDKTGEPIVQDRLTVEGVYVTGPKAGKVFTDSWIFWKNVVGQFRGCVGNGQWYLVQLTKPGRGVRATEVTDPATRQEAAKLLAASF